MGANGCQVACNSGSWHRRWARSVATSASKMDSLLCNAEGEGAGLK